MKSNVFSNIGLQRRITLYVTAGLAATFGVFAFVAIDSANRSSSVILNERITVAQMVALRVESSLAADANLIDATALDLSSGNAQTDPQMAVDQLRANLVDLSERGDVATALFDGDSKPIAVDDPLKMLPVSLQGLTLEFTSTAPQVVHDASDRSSVAFVRQIRSAPGVDLTLIALVRPGPEILAVPATENGAQSQYRVELVSAGGEILGTSSPGDTDFTSRHSDVLVQLVEDDGKSVVEHAPVDAEGERVNHVVAFAPLKQTSLGVLLEQPEDIALALPNDLRRRILLIASVGLVGGLALAWITSRQVVRPIEVLNSRAGEIASGDLDSPVQPSGQDEIRALGESFEMMRQQLQKSVFELSEWGGTLERRVEERTQELAERNAERSLLLDKVITAQEDERKRVARDLHDQVGQSLAFLVMQLGVAESRASASDPAMADTIVEVRETASRTVSEVRRLISDLRPSVLDDLGLSAALQSLVEDRVQQTAVRPDISVGSIPRELSAAVEIAVYRVVQEAVNNVLKHADANSIQIRVWNEDRKLFGEVTDDGRGFDTTKTQKERGGGWSVGLMGMSERIALVGGSLLVESRPGAGTSVRFSVPVDFGGQI